MVSRTCFVVFIRRVSAQSNVAMQDSIPEIVVTGTGTEHYLKDAPVQTEVITAKCWIVMQGLPWKIF